MDQQQNPAPGGVPGPTGRRLHIAHRRSPSEMTPLVSMFANGAQTNSTHPIFFSLLFSSSPPYLSHLPISRYSLFHPIGLCHRRLLPPSSSSVSPNLVQLSGLPPSCLERFDTCLISPPIRPILFLLPYCFPPPTSHVCHGFHGYLAQNSSPTTPVHTSNTSKMPKS